MKSPVTHNLIITHTQPHLDEAAGIWLLRKYGSEVFPGIEHAKVLYLAKELKPGEIAAMLKLGAVFVGVGGGEFDEHAATAFSEQGRRRGECAATLVGRKFGLLTDVAVGPILEEVKYCDSHGKTRETELGSLVKLRNRQNPENPDEVVRWTSVALEALHDYLIVRETHEGAETPDLKEILRNHGAVRSWENKDVIIRLRQEIGQSIGQWNHKHLLTELAALWEAVSWYYRQQPQQASEWLALILDEMYAEQVEFSAAVQEFSEKARVVEFEAVVEIEGKIKIVHQPLAYIHSDNTLMCKASRSTKTGMHTVLILKNSRGNVQVFLDKDWKLNLVNLIRMIRWLELRKKHKSAPWWNWHELGRSEEFPGTRHWFYFKEGEMLFNGSLTKPDVTPTTLTPEEIIYAATHAFRPDLVEKWKSEHGVPAYSDAAGRPRSRGVKRNWRRERQRGNQITEAIETAPMTVDRTATYHEVATDLDKVFDQPLSGDKV